MNIQNLLEQLFLNIKENYPKIFLIVLSYAISYSSFKKLAHILIECFPYLHWNFQFNALEKLEEILFIFYMISFKLMKQFNSAIIRNFC